ncbi:MAG: D-aminoacylase [Rhodothermales bacterium]
MKVNGILLLLLALAWRGAASQPSGQIFTVILEGGQVYDGLGNPPVRADVGLLGDRIAAIGDLSGRRAATRIDAAGLAVVPGFIDIHSHGDRDIFLRPDAGNYLRQGVTTIIAGPDGSSLHPIGEALGRLDARPGAVNFGTMIGHGTVRGEVLGNENRAPTASELERMKQLVDIGMREGAFGLSSGLKYVPGAYATTEEVIELARVAGRYGGIYISHMRDEGLGLMESVHETIRIGEEGRLPTQLTHHKVIGKAMWGSSIETLRLVDEARTRGIDVSMDLYPYTASSTGLTVLFPSWSLEGTQGDLVGRLRDPEQRARIREAILFSLREDRGGGDPANVAVAYCPWDTTLNGKNLSDILRERGQDATLENAAELAMDLQEKGGFSGIFYAMQEEDVRRIMQHPMTMIASDGGIPAPGVGKPHPRNYGTFARVLGTYARDENVLSIPEALRKMSSLPAWRLGLADRGVLRPGAMADVAVINLDTVADPATFQDPHRYSQGVVHVFVNGQAALIDGEPTGIRAGRALRH